MRVRLVSIVAPVALACACASSPVTPDAGPTRDTGPPFSCKTPTRVDGVLDGVVSVSFDTTMTRTRPRDLGLSCGNPDPIAMWAPQEVVEFHVPGSGPLAVEFDTVLDGTDVDFNTVVQVRRECERVPRDVFPVTCFDDFDIVEVRSRGGATVQGGDTIYFVITGWSLPPPDWMLRDRGRVQVDFRVRTNTAPSVDSAYVRLAFEDVNIGAIGTDPDLDVVGIAMNFLGPDGLLLDIWGDGEATIDGDAFIVSLQETPSTADFSVTARVAGSRIALARYLRGVGASAAIVRVFDRVQGASPPLEVPIE